jgi:hypothetical protein
MRLSVIFIAVTIANSVSLFGKKIAKALCNIPELTLNLPTTTIVAQPFLMFC